MKAKSYRVQGFIVKEVNSTFVRYVAEEKRGITEAQVIGAAIQKGLEVITNSEISEYIEKEKIERYKIRQANK